MNEVEKKINNNKTNTIQNKNITFSTDTDTILKVIAIGIVIITAIMIKDKYEEYKAEQQIKLMMYGTTNDLEIEKKNNEMNKQMTEIQRQTNEMIKQQNQINQNMQQEAAKQQRMMQENLKKMNQNINQVGY